MMNRFSSLKPSLRVGVGLVVVTGLILAWAVTSNGKDSKPAKKKPTGAELYAINCNRCHAERYPTERTDAQWKTIILHMRTRAQIPAEDARAILKYLQENN
jgi:mono/diheme cytochrome c family protein